jgi:hypothetical protein
MKNLFCIILFLINIILDSNACNFYNNEDVGLKFCIPKEIIFDSDFIKNINVGKKRDLFKQKYNGKYILRVIISKTNEDEDFVDNSKDKSEVNILNKLNNEETCYFENPTKLHKFFKYKYKIIGEYDFSLDEDGPCTIYTYSFVLLIDTYEIFIDVFYYDPDYNLPTKIQHFLIKYQMKMM